MEASLREAGSSASGESPQKRPRMGSPEREHGMEVRVSEKDKMLAGELYSAGDATLTADRERCQTLLQRLNAAPVAQERERWQILKELFKHLPDGPALGADPAGSVAPHIEPTFRCDYGYNITVGKNFNANFDCCILDCATVTIGDDVFFGPRVQIYTAGHPVVPRIRGNFRSGLEFAKPITIGHRWDGFVCMRSIR